MNKNLKKTTIITITIISLIAIIIFIVINNRSASYTRPNYEPTAVIYHSEMRGMDAGHEFIYDIYQPNKNINEYFYIKSQSQITMTGSGKSNDVDSGSLKSKDDLKIIEKDIEKDKESLKSVYSNILYKYTQNGASIEYKDIDSFPSYPLSDDLFNINVNFIKNKN